MTNTDRSVDVILLFEFDHDEFEGCPEFISQDTCEIDTLDVSVRPVNRAPFVCGAGRDDGLIVARQSEEFN